MNIQWYPGHMTKTRRMMEENISLVDVVIELIDARIPYSSKNPDIDELAKNKYRIIVMNKSDLADDSATAVWTKYFEDKGFKVILTDAKAGKGVNAVTNLAKDLMAEKIERLKQKGRIFVPIRAMIVGIPNVGKSTFINKYVGKTTAKTGDKPGVTRGKQWIKVKKDFELLDTPGILWPKFEDPEVGLKLAFTGAVNDDILDMETAAYEFINLMVATYPDRLRERYNIEFDTIEPVHEIFEKIGRARGFVVKGGEIDRARCAKILMDEFRGGKLGKMTLELPEDIKDMTEEIKKRQEEKKQRDRERKAEYRRKNNK
jgi:ribosome biogenesis GTPase A